MWYHVLRGQKVFVVAPASRRNMEAFEAWSSSGKQVGAGDRLWVLELVAPFPRTMCRTMR